MALVLLLLLPASPSTASVPGIAHDALLSSQGTHEGAPSGVEGPRGTCPISNVEAPRALSRSPRNGPGTGGLSAHSVDPAAVPNSGFEFNVTGYSMPASGSGSFLLTEQETIGNQVLAMGLFANSSLPLVGVFPFWALVDNATGLFVSCGYSVTSVTANRTVSFQALNTQGRTWEVLVNGAGLPDGSPSNNITLNASEATWTGGIGVVSLDNWTSTPWLPALVNLPYTMRVLTGHGWYLPHPVVASWNGTVAPAWGEAGTLQLGYLAPGALEVGTSVAPVGNGTEIWATAAPTRLTVTLNATPTSLDGGATVALVLRAVAAGLPMAGMTVTLASDSGGTFVPASPWLTNGAGIAQGNFTSPLVASTTTVVVSATVGNAFFQGFTNCSITVAPTPLSVAVSASSVKVAEGGTVNLTVEVRRGTEGIPGVNLTFSASVGGGVFAPTPPWVTGPNGKATGTYQAPSQEGALAITFTIALTGYSGSGTLWLNVTGPSTTSSSGSSPWLTAVVGAVVLVVVVLLLVLYVRSRRRPSLPAPEERSGEGPEPGDREVVAEGGSGAKASKGSSVGSLGKGTTRAGPTCSACGTSVEGAKGRFCPSCGAPLAGGEALAPST